MNQDEKIKELEEKVSILEDKYNKLSYELQLIKTRSSTVSWTSESTKVSKNKEVKNNKIIKDVKKSSINFEGRLGKNIMGVLASLLIFISIILFAGIIYKYIDDTLKVFVMFVISVLLLSIGLVKMKKSSKYYILFSSLAGCGAGAFYISCLITYFWFHMLNDIILMLIILIWLIFMVLISKYKSIMFSYICNIGLIVATLLISMKWNGSPLSIILYFCILTSLFLTNDNKYSIRYDFIYLIQIPFVMLLLEFYNEQIYLFILFFIIDILLILFILSKYKISNKYSKILVSILSIVYFLALFINCVGLMNKIYDVESYIINSKNWGCELILILFIISIVVLCFLYYHKFFKDNSYIFYIWYGFTVLFGILAYLETFLFDIINVLPIFILLLVLGIIKDSKVFRITGYCVSFLYLIEMYGSDLKELCLCSIGLLLLIILSIFTFKINKSNLDKYCLTFILVCFTINDFNYLDNYLRSFNIDIDECILYLIITIISVIINTKYYRKDFKSSRIDNVSVIIGYIFNAVMMVISYISICFTSSNEFHFYIYTLGSVALFSVNAAHSLNNFSNKFFIGVYNCLKFSVLVYTLLYRFNAESYVVSVCGILFAIICILLGFKKYMKSFRIYGLILTMICICKLIVIDVSYSVDILRPLGFLIAGILCFGISLIYSKLEKQLLSENK